MKESEKSYIETMSPAEGAYYRFIKLLQTEEIKYGANFRTNWNYGWKIDQIIKQFESTGGGFPSPEFFVAFGLYIMEGDKLKGSGDIRIINTGTTLRFHINNYAKMSELEDFWKKAFDREEYPVTVRDRKGFEYRNPAYVAIEQG